MHSLIDSIFCHCVPKVKLRLFVALLLWYCAGGGKLITKVKWTLRKFGRTTKTSTLKDCTVKKGMENGMKEKKVEKRKEMLRLLRLAHELRGLDERS